MLETNGQGFATFFEALWQQPPFAWQRALAEQVLATSEDQAVWPDAIALPTAAGKTACLDIAVFTLAAQADRLAPGRPLTAPRRIFFVVDRRVIVDEALERANVLAEKLQQADSGVLKAVADRLRLLAGGDRPLACHQLRGGMYRSDAWARSPVQPTIVATTVDQLGSRLLFRAYGRSFKAWPIQAGLTGNDSLILLDEAHCAQPFLETIQAVRRYRTWAEAPLPNPFHLVVMSATPPEGLVRIFRDESDEPRTPDHPLGRRQLASKPARLVVADKAKGSKAGSALAKVLAAEAETLAGDMARGAACAPAIVIFCNRVDTARRTHELLGRKYSDNAVLLTGRMRPFDKDDTVKQRLDLLTAGNAAERRLESPLFVVATQTLEVGANLDFDGLVSEAASLDALRQRFGRLNRMGRPIEARAVLVVRADQATASDDDPVYGAALANTWTKLKAWGDADGLIDFGIAALSPRIESLADEVLAQLNAPAEHAPVMLPAHVDAWVQTAPEPVPTPEVALFLHGPRRSAADVQVCWRADLTGSEWQAWKDAVRLCPPASPETLAVPIGQFRRWLEGAEATAGADVEGGDEALPAVATEVAHHRYVVRWRGRDEVDVVNQPNELRPGDVVVIPAHLMGWEALAALGTDQPIADWGDRASMEVRDKAILRLHPDVVCQWLDAAPLLPFTQLTAEEFDGDPDAQIAKLQDALADIAADPKTSAWLHTAARHFTESKHLDRLLIPHPVQGWVLQGREFLSRCTAEKDTFSDEDDATASGGFSRDLDDHRSWVARYAARFAERCGLPRDIAATVEAGGMHHDLGKADPRFQAWLKGGNPWAGGPLLAKSAELPPSPRENETARERAHYPKGGRHELLSVRLLESRPDLLPEDSHLRDLLLHVVGAHHGHCRPFAPAVDDGESQPVSHDGFAVDSTATGLERLDSGVAERFWRLTRRYGWWGLAWLEAIMRLADHRRSEDEEHQPWRDVV